MKLYWMHERTGRMKNVVQGFLMGMPLDAEDLRILKDYMKQWIAPPIAMPDLNRMAFNEQIEAATDAATLRKVTHALLQFGIDPF